MCCMTDSCVFLEAIWFKRLNFVSGHDHRVLLASTLREMSTLHLWWVRTFEERFNRLDRITPSAEKQALLMFEMSTSPVSTAIFAALRRAFVVFPMALTTTIGLSASAWRCRRSWCFNLSTGAPLLNSTLLVQLVPFEQFQHIGGVALLLQLKCHQTSSPASAAGTSLPELKLLEASSRSRASFSVWEENQKDIRQLNGILSRPGPQSQSHGQRLQFALHEVKFKILKAGNWSRCHITLVANPIYALYPI